MLSGDPRRGSALVISLMMAAILGTILASYLSMAFNQLKSSNRQHNQFQAQRLAETAMEKGLYALNHEFPVWDGGDAGKGQGRALGRNMSLDSTFSGTDGTWALDHTKDTATLTYLKDLGYGKTAYVTIVVDNFMRKASAGSLPLSAVTAETVIKNAQGNLLNRRRISADMEPRNPFQYGVTATGTMEFNYGAFKIRSFEPQTTYGDTLNYAFDDSAQVGAGKLVASYEGSLDVFGKVISGSSGSDSIGSGTKIQDSQTVDPHVNPIDFGLYHEGFYGDFPVFSPPAKVADYIYEVSPEWESLDLGTPSTAGDGYDPATGTYHYTLKNPNDDRFTIGDEQTLNIHGDTVIHVKNDFYLNYLGKMVIKPGASLMMYVGDDVQIIYGDMQNETREPSKLLIMESKTSHTNTPEWYVLNPSEFDGGFYGPNANLTLYGKEYWMSSGTVNGSAMVKNLRTYYSVDLNHDKNLFNNFLQDNRTLDDQFTFAPVNWTEENSSGYLAGDPSP